MIENDTMPNPCVKCDYTGVLHYATHSYAHVNNTVPFKSVHMLECGNPFCRESGLRLELLNLAIIDWNKSNPVLGAGLPEEGTNEESTDADTA